MPNSPLMSSAALQSNESTRVSAKSPIFVDKQKAVAQFFKEDELVEIQAQETKRSEGNYIFVNEMMSDMVSEGHLYSDSIS